MKTPRTRRLPLFHTQGIGSLPRPDAVRTLLARRDTLAPGSCQRALDDMVRFPAQDVARNDRMAASSTR